jgi:D-serine deaminase-like pyridoxal phosphate-dependent protein
VPSLYVWATVMSRPAEFRAIVDACLKALAFDSGPPLVCDEPAVTYECASDEHGRLAVSAATNRLGLSGKIRLIPGDCDPAYPHPSLPRARGRVGRGRWYV